MCCELKKWKYLSFVRAEQTTREHMQHTQLHIHIYTRPHTHTHTHIYTPTCPCNSFYGRNTVRLIHCGAQNFTHTRNSGGNKQSAALSHTCACMWECVCVCVFVYIHLYIYVYCAPIHTNINALQWNGSASVGAYVCAPASVVWGVMKFWRVQLGREFIV